jgi:hypothetical protein
MGRFMLHAASAEPFFHGQHPVSGANAVLYGTCYSTCASYVLIQIGPVISWIIDVIRCTQVALQFGFMVLLGLTVE